MNAQPARERTGLAYLIGILGVVPDRRRAGLGHAALYPAAAAGRRPGRACARRRWQTCARRKPANSDSYGWVDQAKGVVRLPIAEARKLALREWQNPAAARSNLIARVEKATAAPPPPPAKPNPFE